jgi:hypothetical protein
MAFGKAADYCHKADPCVFDAVWRLSPSSPFSLRPPPNSLR